MSTNYYLVPKFIAERGIDLEWVKKIHIGQRSVDGILLQAIRGNFPFKRRQFGFNDSTVLHYPPVHNFETVESWSHMKSIIESGEYSVVDEYNVVVTNEFFIELVENNSGFKTENRYEKTLEWIDDHSDVLSAKSRNYLALDNEGYSFDYREFF